MNARILATALTALLAFSCAAAKQPQQQEQKAEEEEGIVLTGTLEKTVEAGGWLLKTEEKSYLLLNIEEYRGEPWFQEGRKVRVRGREDPDVITFYQQGTPFKVASMAPEDEK